MDGAAFDRVIQRLHLAAGRRSVLTSLAGAGLAVSAASAVDTVTAKKKKKKVTICRNGQTLSVTKKKKGKHLQPGDTAGPCPSTTRPPATTTTTLPPGCHGATPNSCARLDTCQAACSAGHEYDAESCVCVCSSPTTCCFCTRGAGFLSFNGIANSSACADACAAAGGENPTFAGGNGQSAVFDSLHGQCNVTCTPDPMTCPAGIEPSACGDGQSCCDDNSGCCAVDNPVCCGAGCCGRGGVCCNSGGCCSQALPLCCGSVCCLEGSSCCEEDGGCGGDQVCAKNDGEPIGCCVDNPERSRGGGSASMARMTPAEPRAPRRRGRN